MHDPAIGKDLVDLIFEFHAYMTDEIVKSKMMMKENKFGDDSDRDDSDGDDADGDDSDVKEALVVNMTNQLHLILSDITTECSKYQNDHGHSEFRRCPYVVRFGPNSKVVFMVKNVEDGVSVSHA